MAEQSLTQTSGTTGEPIAVLKDGYDQIHMWAVLRVAPELASAGGKPESPSGAPDLT